MFIRVHSHPGFIRGELLRELFSPHNRERRGHNPSLNLFLLKFLLDTCPFCGATDTRFRLRVMSPLGFKATVGSLRFSSGATPADSWQPAWQPVTFPTYMFQQRLDAG